MSQQNAITDPAPTVEDPAEPVDTEQPDQPAPTSTAMVHVPKPPPTFQERLDDSRDAFRSTRKTYDGSKSSVADAKAEMEQAQVTYDDAMSAASVSRSEHLGDTRDLIRVLQEHEARLIGEAAA